MSYFVCMNFLKCLDSMEVDASSSRLEWIVFLANKYRNLFIEGTKLTLYVAIVGTLIGFLLGFVIGVIQNQKISPNDNIVKKSAVWVFKWIAAVYVELFRDTPMIVQAMVIYYGLRTSGVEIEPVPAGILVTVLNTGAYMAETVRAGIHSIDVGQEEGGLAMGMSPLSVMTNVILPQAFMNIFPEMGNMFLTNLKMTSVLNVIGVMELFLMAKTVGGINYKYFEAYLVIAIVYLVLCFIFNRLFMLLEKKMKGKPDYALAMEFMEEKAVS